MDIREEKSMDTLESVLLKDDISGIMESLLDKSGTPRFFLGIIISKNGGYIINSTGSISHLEWLGLSRFLSDYCDGSADDFFESNMIDEEEDNGSK